MSLPNYEWDLRCQGRFVFAHEIPVTDVAIGDTGMHVDDEDDHKRAQMIDPWQARQRRRQNAPPAVRRSDLGWRGNHSSLILGRREGACLKSQPQSLDAGTILKGWRAALGLSTECLPPTSCA